MSQLGGFAVSPVSNLLTPTVIPTLYSDEHVRFPNATPDNTGAPQGLNCAGFGSSVMVTASFGMAAAQWAIERALKDAP